MGKKIRVAELHTTRLNRDKNGATNIGTQFQRLMCDKVPVRQMTSRTRFIRSLTSCDDVGTTSGAHTNSVV